jgi:hypothetical protein
MNLSGTRPAVSDACLRGLVLDLAASPQRWLHLVQYDPARRWYQRLLWEEDREVWLLSWLPGLGRGRPARPAGDGAVGRDRVCWRRRRPLEQGELDRRLAAGRRGTGFAPAAVGRGAAD